MFLYRSKPILTLLISQTGRDDSYAESTDRVHSKRIMAHRYTYLAIARSRAHTRTPTLSSLSECLSLTSITEKNVPYRSLSRALPLEAESTDRYQVSVHVYIYCVRKKKNERTNERTNEGAENFDRSQTFSGGKHEVCALVAAVWFFFFTRKTRKSLSQTGARIVSREKLD